MIGRLKRIMKKIINVVLLLLSITFFIGCGEGDEDKVKNESKKINLRVDDR